MNLAHLHLLVNTAPIFGAFTGAALLALALVVRGRDSLVLGGLVALLVTACATAAAYLTGLGAVDVISGMPRTSNEALEHHHDRALVALVVVLIVTLVAAAVYVVVRFRHGRFGRRVVALLLGLALAASGVLAWTGLAGGHVNHPELQDSADRADGPVREHH